MAELYPDWDAMQDAIQLPDDWWIPGMVRTFRFGFRWDILGFLTRPLPSFAPPLRGFWGPQIGEHVEFGARKFGIDLYHPRVVMDFTEMWTPVPSCGRTVLEWAWVNDPPAEYFCIGYDPTDTTSPWSDRAGWVLTPPVPWTMIAMGDYSGRCGVSVQKYFP